MGNVTLAGATSGQITLAPTAVAGTNTLTLPAATGTVLTTAGGQIITGTTTVSNLALNGSTSGTTTLSPSATASGTVTLPAGTGTVAVNGVSTNIVNGTAVTPSGTSTSLSTTIPSWARRITVMFSNVNTNGTSLPMIQLGPSGGLATTGYFGLSAYISGAGAQTGTQITNGLAIWNFNNVATTPKAYGSAIFSLLNPSTYNWVMQSVTARGDTNWVSHASGGITLSGPLTQLALTTTGGTDTFSGGTVNILYE